jgi:hypothetical protein
MNDQIQQHAVSVIEYLRSFSHEDKMDILSRATKIAQDQERARLDQIRQEKMLAEMEAEMRSFQNGGTVTADISIQYALANATIQRVVNGAISAHDAARAVFNNQSINPEIKVMMIKEIYVNRKLGNIEEISDVLNDMAKFLL